MKRIWYSFALDYVKPLQVLRLLYEPDGAALLGRSHRKDRHCADTQITMNSSHKQELKKEGVCPDHQL